jgi:hypothetical protein
MANFLAKLNVAGAYPGRAPLIQGRLLPLCSNKRPGKKKTLAYLFSLLVKKGRKSFVT